MSMFTSGFQESERSEVTIQDGSADNFAQLLEFAYTGYFQLSVTNVCGILRMACYMDFSHAIDVCVEYIIDMYYNGINLDDLFEIYCLADSHYPISVLVDILHHYLLKNFLKLANTRAFLDHASKDFVETCLSSEEIESDTSKEVEILQCTLNWLRHDWNQRKTHTVDLLKKVRLGLVSSASLKQILGDEVLAILECMKMVEEVVKLHAKTAPMALIESHPDMFATRNTITAPVYIEVRESEICLHTRTNKRCYKLGRSTSFPGDCPSNPAIIQDRGNGVSLLVTGGQVYVAGGLGEDWILEDDEHRAPSPRCGFYKYDPQRGVWVTLPPMPVALAYPALVELDGYVYVIGSSSQKYFDSYDVLRFDIAARRWQQISPLPVNLNDMSAVALNGYILVAGSSVKGSSSVRILGNVYVMRLFVLALDPKTCIWSVAYKARLPIPEGIPADLGYIHQYPIQIFMHNGTCYFQSVKYENERYEIMVEEVIWDCIDGKPRITLGEEVDQALTFGALLKDEDVVNPSQMLTFDKNKVRLSYMPQCSLPHDKDEPFMKAIHSW
ncbi:kelch repeat and BTB domain-containing protein 8-like [Amphiura filiformis]|uniref:kelch repeat and BTB domain-containing protein 8-like n=1 Tax=Amphiura filiformis TaxID=82378 RepID=UPI003B220314